MNSTSWRKRRSVSKRSAYTLLELLLALSLTIVVLSTIATAIYVNLFALARAQASIERKQIARSVLAMIGNDIRAAVQFRAADYSGLEEVLLSQQLVAGITPTGEFEEDEDGEIDVNQLNESSLSDATEEEEEESDQWSIGLVGDSNYIWLDISRLPRIDQYHPLIQTSQDAVRTGSDIKQVVYFVAATGRRDDSNNILTEESSDGRQGLFRDEIDRAVAFYQGGFAPGTPQEYSQLVATEVVQLEFRYFDGTDWLTQWDSTENEGFPSAVEVNIVLDSNPQSDPADFNNQGDDRFERYRSVVHLPLAEIEEEEDEDG